MSLGVLYWLCCWLLCPEAAAQVRSAGRGPYPCRMAGDQEHAQRCCNKSTSLLLGRGAWHAVLWAEQGQLRAAAAPGRRDEIAA